MQEENNVNNEIEQRDEAARVAAKNDVPIIEDPAEAMVCDGCQ
jgi:hypothetical protein